MVLNRICGLLLVLAVASCPGGSALAAGASPAGAQKRPLVLLKPTSIPAADDRSAKSTASRPSEGQIVQWLRELKPLPKIHYSFPIHASVLNVGDPRLFEYVRITHAATLHGTWVKPQEVEAVVHACAKVNAAGPKIPASLAILYPPWHGVWPKTEPPTTTGPLHDRELAHMREKLESLRSWIHAANERQRASVSISALLLDSEAFIVKQEDAAWNDAIIRKLLDAHKLAVELFPKTRIEWYARGVLECACKNGWDKNPYYTFSPGEDVLGYSVRLYRVWEPHGTREAFRRTVELAGGKSVTPWIALGAGYRRLATPNGAEWRQEYDYDVVYSAMLGAEINGSWYAARPEWFAPWDAARVVVFYPKPFCHSTWERHFVAYVRGATGISEMPP